MGKLYFTIAVFLPQNMSLNSFLTTKSIKKPSYQWLGSMKVNQKIAIGYALALGISVFGTVLGVTTGNYLEERALKKEEQVLTETTALHRLQAGVLQVRTHQQQLIPLSKQPKSFDEEYAHIIQHAKTIQETWLEIKAIAAEEESHSDEEILTLKKFTQSYEETPSKFLNSLNQLVRDIRVLNLDTPEKVRLAQTKLLKFTNSELAIKFDGISDNLSEIIKDFYKKQKKAEQELKAAIIFRNYIVFSSALISIMIATLLARQISRAISSPILELNNVAKKVTESENFDLQVPVTTEDEVGSLASSFNHLINRVKQLLEEQTANAAHLRAIIDNLADGLLVSDNNGKIINYNPAMTRMFGLGDVDINGISCQDFLPEVIELVNKTQKNPTAVFTTELINDKQFFKATVTAILEANCIGFL